ncbi:hypothetical protein BDV96DRAFT_578470 [Lophiotrema nucula]|uniref:Uncharacterized protein n=1 Tax=Lophiotrema nucula TaxID=690887 RepID=A0A6A5Z641_9PLEO|nr:hypothetical protein BDV96DRAFT_578470 [Lophiotrema nucula]
MNTESHPLASLSFRPLPSSSRPSSNILLYTPQEQDSNAIITNSPNVIILCTWLGGSTSSRVAVYCRGYQRLFPSTPILLIRTMLSDATMKSFAIVQKQLEPARDFLVSLFPAISSQKGQIEPSDGALLHVFSHGGCNSALQLSRLLRRSSSENLLPFPIPLLGIILDCCPGSSAFSKTYTAATYSVPDRQPINFVGRVLLWPSIATMCTLQALGIMSSVNDLRRELNDFATFGPVPRLYLHSRGDEVVSVEDVSSHADEIMKWGVKVFRHVWDRAAHCALPVEDSERYWSAIMQFVEDARLAAKSKL